MIALPDFQSKWLTCVWGLTLLNLEFLSVLLFLGGPASERPSV